jgi:hypothetical protein
MFNVQKTELSLPRARLCRAVFTDAKFISLFLRADQVDDMLYRDEATGVSRGRR